MPRLRAFSLCKNILFHYDRHYFHVIQIHVLLNLILHNLNIDTFNEPTGRIAKSQNNAQQASLATPIYQRSGDLLVLASFIK